MKILMVGIMEVKLYVMKDIKSMKKFKKLRENTGELQSESQKYQNNYYSSEYH